MAQPLAIEDLQELERDAPTPGIVDESPRQCKIYLSKKAPGPIMLTWNPGKGGVQTRIRLEPGKSVIQPLSKAEVWFGPFTVPERYMASTSQRQKESLQEFWRTEKSRVLNRYDYPRQHLRDGFSPVGPHRFPDVTCTVVEADGTENESIRLHQLYKIGDWDLTEFAQTESVNEMKQRYEDRLAEQKEKYESQLSLQASQIARIEGMLAGAGIGAAQKK